MICHIEQIKSYHGFASLANYPQLFLLGPLGVTFFFVLSGFLITYLLLNEQSRLGRIEIKRFYVRRALRIWPVYYFLTFLAFFIFPNIGWLSISQLGDVWTSDGYAKLALFILMSAHISQEYFSSVIYGGILWSTSVEEHFYLLWPHVIQRSGKHLVVALSGIITAVIILKIIMVDPRTPQLIRAIGYYFTVFRIECMAIGALGAVLFTRQQVKWLFPWYIQVLNLTVLVFHFMRITRGGYRLEALYSIFFLIIILNVAGNPRSIFKLRNAFFEFMGKISFGLYAYQWVCVAVVVKLVKDFADPWWGLEINAVIYSGSFALTTLAAYLSYKYLESPFLALKARFAT